MNELDMAQEAQKELERINADIEKAEQLIKEKKYKPAKKVLGEIIEMIEMTQEIFDADTDRVYFYFRNPLEGLLTKFIFKPSKDIEFTSFDFCKVYYLNAVILAQEGKYDDALEELKKAYRWNPVCAEVYQAEEAIYLETKQYDMLLQRAKESIAVAYSRPALSAAYHYLGMYYLKTEDFETASAMFFVSLSFNPRERKSQVMLEYLETRKGKEQVMPSPEELKMLMTMKSIPIGINSDILQICYQTGMEARDAKKYTVAKFYLETLHSLTLDPEVEKVVIEIDGAMKK